MSTTVRINKYLSASGYCSRREADKLIQAGRVTIDGQTADLGSQVQPGQQVMVDQQQVSPEGVPKVYLAFYKPRGIECTTHQGVKNNVVDYIRYSERIFPIGRLDKDSEGLLLLTNQGDIVNDILRARNGHEKEYIVEVNKPIQPDFAHRMSKGIPILGTVTLPCKVQVLGPQLFSIVLTQGLNRQIRRMCEYLGYQVVALKRVRIMNIRLDIPTGAHRALRPDEVAQLLANLAQHPTVPPHDKPQPIKPITHVRNQRRPRPGTARR